MKAARMFRRCFMNNSAAQQEHSAHWLCKNRAVIKLKKKKNDVIFCDILCCPCLGKITV